MDRFALIAPRLFDGESFHKDLVLHIEDGHIAALSDRTGPLPQLRAEGLVTPGMVDLQVNGGGGEMLGPTTDPAQIARLLDTHAKLGATSILPTLITDSAEVTARVIAAGIACRDLPGFLGLHLEGPHLDPARKGAHDPALIRPMTEEDLERLLVAAQALPALMVTLAPAAVSDAQITRLAAGGVIVSLGHSDCSFEEAESATRAGARCTTHLFNAMSQPQGRAPGLAGAVLAGSLCAGMIADGHHISLPMMQIALRARGAGIYLVSDAMAVAGTGDDGFTLNGRQVLRRDGRLTLQDGTLAGADITLPESVAVLTRTAGIDPARALAMATSIPADVIGTSCGRIAAGGRADLLTLTEEFRLTAVWKSGRRLS